MRLAIALTFALALAGCGGSERGTQTEGEPPATETRAGQSLTVAGCPIDEAAFCQRAAQAGHALIVVGHAGLTFPTVARITSPSVPTEAESHG